MLLSFLFVVLFPCVVCVLILSQTRCRSNNVANSAAATQTIILIIITIIIVIMIIMIIIIIIVISMIITCNSMCFETAP